MEENERTRVRGMGGLRGIEVSADSWVLEVSADSWVLEVSADSGI